MIERQAVIVQARTYLEIPWRHQGRNAYGMDCVGLVMAVAKWSGMSFHDPAVYPRQPEAHYFLTHLRTGGLLPIPIEAAQAGDVLVFRDGRFPCHIAILAEDAASMIHAYAKRRMVCEERLSPDWLARRSAAFAIPGVG